MTEPSSEGAEPPQDRAPRRQRWIASERPCVRVAETLPAADRDPTPVARAGATATDPNSSKTLSTSASNATAGNTSSSRRAGPPTLDIAWLPASQADLSSNTRWLADQDVFRSELARLSHARQWHKVAAMIGCALLEAPYATGSTRTGLMLDLARSYRDQLDDPRRAEKAFAALVAEQPENSEAIAYLAASYASRSEWFATYELYFAAVEPTRTPDQRLAWTLRAERIAIDRLGDAELAIRAWRQLWSLGASREETAERLTGTDRHRRLHTEPWAALAQRDDRLAEPESSRKFLDTRPRSTGKRIGRPVTSSEP